MPAPVTTTIFLHFATESERLDSVRRVEGSPEALPRSRVIVIGCLGGGRPMTGGRGHRARGGRGR